MRLGKALSDQNIGKVYLNMVTYMDISAKQYCRIENFDQAKQQETFDYARNETLV